jgi:hypothetical protein
MQPHLTDGQLRTYLDDDTDPTVAEHLTNCPTCRSRLQAVTARSAQTAKSLAALAPTPAEQPSQPQTALARLKQSPRKETSMLKSMFSSRLRPVWVGAAAVLALIVVLSFPNVRALASNFLGLFRVQNIQVIQIDPSRIGELNGGTALGQRIGEMFSDSFKSIKEPGEPQEVADAAAASAAAGFNVRLLDNGQTPAITVQGSSAFEFTVDRARMQAILDDGGFDTQLPASLDGAPIKIEIPAGVAVAYGKCPQPSDQAETRTGTEWRALSSCVILAQIPSPTITAPDDLDVPQLVEIGLQFIGMSEAEAKQVSSTVDFSTTLIIPIPRNAATVADVQVDGVKGTYLGRFADDGVPASYTVLWVKDGIVYALSGFGSQTEAVNLANSLK